MTGKAEILDTSEARQRAALYDKYASRQEDEQEKAALTRLADRESDVAETQFLKESLQSTPHHNR